MAAGVSPERLGEVIENGKRKLFSERERRVKPHRDEKILTAWNGLMVVSFSEAGAILGRSDYLSAAMRNAEFLLTNLRKNGLLLRSWKDGQAKFNAYLEDYAFLIDGLVALYETTGTIRWLEEALSLADKMVEEFWDEDEGGFFFTGKSHENLIVRSKDYFDNATPSGNSVASEALLKLSLLTDREDFRNKAVTVLGQVADFARRYPTGFGRALGAIDFQLSEPKEIAVIKIDDAQARPLITEIWRSFLPNKTVAAAASGDREAAELIPLLRDRSAVNGKSTVYVCERRTCQAPVTEPEDLRAQLL
jgi:hypothetical protein